MSAFKHHDELPQSPDRSMHVVAFGICALSGGMVGFLLALAVL